MTLCAVVEQSIEHCQTSFFFKYQFLWDVTSCLECTYIEVKDVLIYSSFQTFAVFCMLYVFFWVIPRRLSFICRRFGTHRMTMFHKCRGFHRKTRLGSKMA